MCREERCNVLHVSADLPVGTEGQRPDGHGLHWHSALHPPDVQHQEFHLGRWPDEEHLIAPLPGGEQDAVARQQGEDVAPVKQWFTVHDDKRDCFIHPSIMFRKKTGHSGPVGIYCGLFVFGHRMQSLWRSTALISWWITASLASWVIFVIWG